MARSRDHSNQKNYTFDRVGFETIQKFIFMRCRGHFRTLREILWRMMASRASGSILGPYFGGSLLVGSQGGGLQLAFQVLQWHFGRSRGHFRNLREILWRLMASRAFKSILEPCFSGSFLIGSSVGISSALVAIFGIHATFCGESWQREPLGQFQGLASVGHF